MRTLVVCLALAACSSSHPSVDVDAAPDSPPDAPDAVAFRYAPAWGGVTAVAVVTSADWTTPLVTLTAAGDGTFTGSAPVPAGTYTYLFQVTGDADAGNKAETLQRYTLDPAAGVVACPTDAPSYSAMVMNPCSVLTVPLGTAPALYHVTGRVVVDGAPAAGWLVLLEREETGQHHYFVNRTTTGADGTYDLAGAAGKYRLQLQHPQYEAKTDAQLDAGGAHTLRRMISAAFDVAADVPVADAEVSFPDYASFAPRTTATLPTTFSFGNTAARPTHLEVYGTGNHGAGNEIGDPWYSGAATTGAQAAFTGAFGTSHAAETMVAPGERYFWGIEQARPGTPAWTAQTFVFPITWH